jgi:methionine aminotransferase
MNKTHPIRSKLPQVGTTIFTTMSGLAHKHGAINLSQGFPGFSISEALISLVNKYMLQGKNQYAPMAGVQELREEISALQRDFYAANYNPDSEITITAGATQGIYTTISALVHPGDEVIMFSPAYDCYSPAVEVNGGKSVFVELNSQDYAIPWEEVKQAISEKTRMILVNSPHNPTGAVWTAKDLEKLEELVAGTGIIVLSDEVYAHIIYDEVKHVSVASSTTLRDQSVIVHSFGKTFHATGWKMGYVLAPEHLMQEFRKVHQYLVFSVNTPVQ